MLGLFTKKSGNHLDIKEGDFVTSTLGHFKNKKVTRVRKVYHDEGNSISIEGTKDKYWSKYLVKV